MDKNIIILSVLWCCFSGRCISLQKSLNDWLVNAFSGCAATPTKEVAEVQLGGIMGNWVFWVVECDTISPLPCIHPSSRVSKHPIFPCITSTYLTSPIYITYFLWTSIQLPEAKPSYIWTDRHATTCEGRIPSAIFKHRFILLGKETYL